MHIKTRELNGIFQAECHQLFNRLLWIVFASISLAIIAFGVWVVNANPFVFSQDVKLRYFEIVLAIFSLFVGPAVIFFVGLSKIFRKPGMYFTGVRVVGKGIELGKFSLNVNALSQNEKWDNKCLVDDRLGEWKQIRRFNNNPINILIVLCKRSELSKQYLIERVVFSSRNKCLFQMLGYDRSGTRSNDIFIISRGVLYLLGNDNGMYPEDILSFRARTANIISRWNPTIVLSCTLKTIPNLADLGSVLAFGVLGGIDLTIERNIKSREYQEKIFDSLNNEKCIFMDFNQD